eukprot:360078-Chlamydomonas_euryale.AAC.7
MEHGRLPRWQAHKSQACCRIICACSVLVVHVGRLNPRCNTACGRSRWVHTVGRRICRSSTAGLCSCCGGTAARMRTRCSGITVRPNSCFSVATPRYDALRASYRGLYHLSRILCTCQCTAVLGLGCKCTSFRTAQLRCCWRDNYGVAAVLQASKQQPLTLGRSSTLGALRRHTR